ncbi:MAG: phosphoenolpyruvate--protein phosphotransferase [Desulfococcaceae bacterium]
MTERDGRERVFKGIGAAPGICIGKAYLVDREGVNVVKQYFVGEAGAAEEGARFRNAVEAAKAELSAIIADIAPEFRQHAAILETHILLLKDKALFDKTMAVIEQEQVNAEWALKKVVSELKRVFQNMEDPYFRERSADIVHVSDRIMRNLVGKEPVDIRAIDKRVILVATDLSPAQTSQIQLERIKGFVTAAGGVASHTGIIARTLEIPAVLGLQNVTNLIRTDDLIVLDGGDGTLIVNPAEQTLVEYEERSSRYEAHRKRIRRVSQLPAQSLDGVSIQIMGNIELPEEVVSVRDHGGNGIGLYRTEFQYMNRSGFPAEDELFDKYRDVVEVMSPCPVTIRTLDINGDKAAPYACDTLEANPALGLRAIRYCLARPDVFRAQLRAILRAAAYGQVRIMFPMISSLDEVVQAKALLREAAASLDAENRPFRADIEVGIMIEVPSAVILADVLAEEVDFFSIGTNDLIQYALAIDRGNRYVSHLYHPLHPAILRMIRHVTEVGRTRGVNVYMCGEMAGDPLHLPILIGMGLRELSMNPQSIPAVKNAIRNLRAGELPEFLDEIQALRRQDQIHGLLRERFGHILDAPNLNS